MQTFNVLKMTSKKLKHSIPKKKLHLLHSHNSLKRRNQDMDKFEITDAGDGLGFLQYPAELH